MTTPNRIPAPPVPPPSAPRKPVPDLFRREPKTNGQCVLVYGQPGVGKTSLCCALPGPVAYLDIENSLPRQLFDKMPEKYRDNVFIYNFDEHKCTWQALIEAISDMNAFSGFKSIVVDSATVAQRLSFDAVAIKYGQGAAAGIESVPYGKGYGYAASEWTTQLLPLATLHAEAGRNFVLVAHSMNAKVANPGGSDYLSVFPQLYGAGIEKGDNNIQGSVFAWANHCIYMDYDKAISKEGKVRGNGTRCIYTSGQNWIRAKTRGRAPETIIPDPENLEEVWAQLFA